MREDWGRKELSPVFLLFAALSVVAVLFAFVDLGQSGFWTDELFTFFIVGHKGGLAEVLRRALTDTHPPAYYFVLYGWSRIAGLSEAALRLPSAVFAVSAAAVFYFGLRGVFSATARAFVLALSLYSTFWFDQSQNIRSYSLCILVSALLPVLALAARRQVAAGSRLPAWPCLGLMLAGAFGAACHSYVFLEVGLVYLFVVATVPALALRAVLVLWGLVIAGGYGLYAHALLHATQQDVHHMWFRNDPVFFFNQITVAYRVVFGVSGWIIAGLLGLSAWRRRGEPRAVGEGADDRRWVVGLAAFGHFGMFGLGIFVSLAIAPSMSSINLSTAAPLLWILMAWLYDVGAPRGSGRWDKVFAGLLMLGVLVHVPILAGRFFDRTEQWRASARAIAAMPACAGKPIPVALPEKFGPDTPFFRTLAHDSFYGHYFPEPARLVVYSRDELAGRQPNPGLAALAAARASGADPCPVLAWAVHDFDPAEAVTVATDLQRLPGMPPAAVAIRRFDHRGHEELGYSVSEGAYVYVAARTGSNSGR